MVEEEARPYVGNTPMTLIYNGTDTQLFRPSAHKIQNGKLNIITAAAFEERKGMHYIIKALADYKTVTKSDMISMDPVIRNMPLIYQN